jgi:hypothetical protein
MYIIRDIFGWLLEKVLAIIGFIVLGAVLGTIWFVVGLLVGVPYALLTSSYSNELATKFLLFGPPIVLILNFIFLVDSRATLWKKRWLRPTRFPRWGFFLPFTWILLPAIANGVSKILAVCGWSEVARVVFYYRFETLWIPPVLLCIFLVVAGVSEEILRRQNRRKLMKEMFKPQ